MTREQLGALILDSERQLYSTAKTILYSDQDCADAIQDTIVKAFLKIDTLKNDKYARTWLVRILINECYSILRKSSKLVSLDEMNDKGESGSSMKTCGGADKEAEKSAPRRFDCPVSPRTMRTGEDERVSTPVSTASGMA